MKSQYCALLVGACISFPVVSMWQQVSGQKDEETLCTVHFESTATILCDTPNNSTIKYYLEHPDHPFIAKGLKPYTQGNGGLLNPKLVEYDCVAQPVGRGGEQVMESIKPIGMSYGARITVKGVVETEGIAPLALNAKECGQHYEQHPESGWRYHYETKLLEDVILGALKERAVDRGISDLTDYFFNGGEFLEKYIEIIKEAWTSHLSDDDDGQYTSEQIVLIKRYFPRKAYWRSRWYDDRRMGRQNSLELSSYARNERDGAKFKVILDTFAIDVKRVGEKSGSEIFSEMIESLVTEKTAGDTEQTK